MKDQFGAQSSTYRQISKRQLGSAQLTSKQLERIMNLGYNMRFIFMQDSSIKIVEEIIKIINCMNVSVFKYKQKMEPSFQFFKLSALETASQPNKTPTQKSDKNITIKQQQSPTVQSNRQQLIRTLVEQLYNARQDAIKIQQMGQGISFVSSQDNLNDVEKQLRDCINTIKSKDSDQQSTKSETSKQKVRIETQAKMTKKLLQQVTKASLQKDQKITSLKITISKLEQHIIKQVKNQNQKGNDFSLDIDRQIVKPMVNDPTILIKSEALEREVVYLKRQIQNLRQNMGQSTDTNQNKMKFGHKSMQIQRQKQFVALSRQYGKIKEEVSLVVKGSQHTESSNGSDDYQQDFNYEDNYLNFRTQFQILNQKYKNLQIMYQSAKQQNERLVQLSKQQSSAKRSHDNSVGSPHHQHLIASTNTNANSKKTSTNMLGGSGYSKIGTRFGGSSSRKKMDLQSDDQQDIIRNIQDINKMEVLNSSSIGVTSFQSLINPKELASKIQGFDYSNCIINKVNASKFIQSFQAKLTLVLQYVCIIQLYFTKSFLSCVREELMMEDSVVIKSITNADLNQSYYVQQSQSQQENSFTGVNTSKLSYASSPQANQNNQVGGAKNINDELSDSIVSLPAPVSPIKQKNRKTVQKLQAQIKQLSSLIPNEYLNPHQLSRDPQFMERVLKLRENNIAAIISNLVKENQVFKKCLNQMIKSQENFTKENNQVYFDQEGELRRRSSSTNSIGLPTSKEKCKDKGGQNCSLM